MSHSQVDSLIQYLNSSPSPFHAVTTAVHALDAAGFAPWSALDAAGPPPPHTKGYVVQDGSLLAFCTGEHPPAQAGFRIIAAHTDSPNLRIQPAPHLIEHGYVRLQLAPYGGVLLTTWLDRDLGIAGRVVYREGNAQRSALVNLQEPLCRIPNLAIHLNRDVNKQGLKLNPQTHLPAVLGCAGEPSAKPLQQLLGQRLGIDPGQVLTWDLSLYDLTPARVAGLDGAFIHSGRLDNLVSCHAGLHALLAVAQSAPPTRTAVLALFDHEEIGSTTARGATSPLLEQLLIQLSGSQQGLTNYHASLPQSVVLSADMAHAVHPAYPDKHDALHLPHLNAGPVIKQNVNQRYGTEATTAALIIRLCEQAQVPYQWFVNRTDLSCGATVGPLIAANLGIPTVDVGTAMLSMHSAREQCGTADVPLFIATMTAFFQ